MRRPSADIVIPTQRWRFPSIAAAAIGSAAILSLLGCGGPFDASPSIPRAQSPLIGGSDSQPCAWPSVGWLPDLCTATLIHPRLIVYAAHCGTDFATVTFHGPAGRRSVPIVRCDVEPDGAVGNGRDVAFCLLGQPVDDVPIVPVLAGCERSLVVPGLPVTLVGFGSAGAADSIGTKREWTAPLIRVGTELTVGGDGHSICEGDSGGPAFAQLAPQAGTGFDGSWRLIAVSSSTNSAACDGTREARLSPVASVLGWLESASGTDVTPCFDALQQWSPTAACGGFPRAANTGGSTDSEVCGDAPANPLLQLSTTCGDPFTATDRDGGLVTTVQPDAGGCAVMSRQTCPCDGLLDCGLVYFILAVSIITASRSTLRRAGPP